MEMKRMQPKKKGVLTLSQMPGAIILFSVAVIVTAVMATVLTNIQTTQISGTYAYNITANGLSGLNTFAGFFNPIAVILAAVVIIGLIMSAFIYSRGGGMSGGV